MQLEYSKIKQSIKQSLFLKNAFVLFVGTMIANVLNYIFNLALGRLLSVQEYGELVALESIFLIIGVVGATILAAATRQVATYKARNDQQGLKQFKNYFEKLCIVFGFIVCITMLLFSGTIADFLKTPFGPIIVLDIGFIFVFIAAFYTAILQGQQRFKAMAVIAIIGSALKLIIGIGLIILGFSITGAMIGFVFTAVFSAIAIYFLTRNINKIQIDKNISKIKISKKHIVSMSKFFFAVLCLTLLYNTDLLLVKHYFSPEDGGLYSSLAMLARIIFFGTGIIAAVLLPMATEKYEKGQNHLSLFFASIGLVTACSAVLCTLYFLFPNLIISLLFGDKYSLGANLLGYMALMMSVYSLLNVLIFYLLSIKRFYFLVPLIFGTILQVVLILYLHTSLFQIIMISLIIISSIFVIASLGLFLDKKKIVNA